MFAENYVFGEILLLFSLCAAYGFFLTNMNESHGTVSQSTS